MRTKDVRVVEIDSWVFDWVAGVQEHLSFSIELDCVGGFVDSICWYDWWVVHHSLSFGSHVLFVHIFDMIDESFGSLCECRWFEESSDSFNHDININILQVDKKQSYLVHLN